MSRLVPLAGELIRLADQDATTPVLVVPNYLSLRPAFFAQLVADLAAHGDRQVRIDCLSPGGGWWTELRCRRDVARINRMFAATTTPSGRLSGFARAELAATFGRPGGIHRSLIIGYCDRSVTLPNWATAIPLAA